VTLIDLGSVTVWTSPTLNPPEWVEQPHLFIDVLDLHAAPQVDQAQLHRHYGRLIQFGETTFDIYNQIDVIGHYVRVEILDSTGALVRMWFGVIEAELNDVRGASTLDNGISTGIQRFQAFGLLRLLERVFFRSTTKFRDPDETEAITISRGIPFNMSEDGDYAETGNRSAETSDGVYVFSDAPELADEWTAWTAAQYLLVNHVPLDCNDNPIATWGLSGDQATLDWYIVHTRTEGRSVKDILDELIPRKRAVGYWVDYEEESNFVRVNVFSLNGSDLVLPTGTIPANPDQRELDFEYAVSIQRATLRNVSTTKYNRIVARGEHRTSTTTLRFNPQYAELDKGWTSDQEDSYLEGASNKVGYGALSLLEKYRANAIVRTADTFAPVFCRFQLGDDWNKRADTLFQNEDTRQWHVAPLLDSDGIPRTEYDAGSNPDGELMWVKTIHFNMKLALRQGLDYSDSRIDTGEYIEPVSDEIQALDTTQYVRPLFFWRNASTSRYELLENLGLSSAFESDVRPWSIQPEIKGRGPVVDLRVIGGPQQFIADSYWSGAAVTDPAHDPAKNGGLDYTAFYATLTINTGVPFEYIIDIGTNQTGIMRRTLFIDVPDARHDFVVPYTVVGIGENGVKQTTSGGVIRDDRDRLKLIAESAAAWYGVLRQTLEVSFRKISPVVELGSLIVAIPSNYQREDVNTVVTRLSYNFSDPRNAFTEFETSFAEFELL
jgi:hypothetical protein